MDTHLIHQHLIRQRPNTISAIAFVTMLWIPTNATSAEFHLGAGVASPSSGRLVPALDLGFQASDVMISAMSGGIKTSAYYHNYYNLNLLFYFSKWGTGILGDLYAGFGLGGLYAEKGFNNYPESTAAEEVDIDSGIGPAFRIESRPFDGPIFLAIEFTMGLGPTSLFGGWGDFGQASIGCHL